MEISAEIIEKSRIDGAAYRQPPSYDSQSNSNGTFTPGTIAILSHHFIFQFRTEDNSPSRELMLLHRSVDLCTADLKGTVMGGGLLTLFLKNLRILQFDFKSWDDCQCVQRMMEKLSRIDDPQWHYALGFDPSSSTTQNEQKIASLRYDAIKFQKFLNLPSDMFRVSSVNENFNVCTTYPRELLVPASIDDEVIASSAKFRDGGRFPIISYYHARNCAFLLRCAQPLVGSNDFRNRQDEQLVNAALANNQKGYIVDTRTPEQAKQARSKGGGHEADYCYTQWRRIHRSVPRFKQLQDSLARHVEAVNIEDSDKYISKLSSAGWVSAVHELLICSAVVAQTLECERTSVVIHGDLGADTTLAVTSLTQLILDHRTRTLHGFVELIEREWLAAGHPFSSRCARGAFGGRTQAGLEGASFLCFLHAVHELSRQFAASFEFSEAFLVALFDHAYASECGTFICDSETQRHQLDVYAKSPSLWDKLLFSEERSKYVNMFYQERQAPIWPSVAPQSLTIWQELFMRWSIDQAESEAAQKTVHRIVENSLNKARRPLSSIGSISSDLSNTSVSG